MPAKPFIQYDNIKRWILQGLGNKTKRFPTAVSFLALKTVELIPYFDFFPSVLTRRLIVCEKACDCQRGGCACRGGWMEGVGSGSEATSPSLHTRLPVDIWM